MIDIPVEVKDALREGTYRKNYRINVLNDDGTTDFTIDNNNLVKESVSIDERMNSGDKLKYGLCEGSSLEFQYFGMANITGRRVQVFVDVSYISTNTILSNANPTYVIVDPGSYFVVVPANSPSFELTGTGFFEPLEVPTSSEEQKLRFIKRHTGDRMTIISSSEISVTLERVDGALFLASYTIPMGFFDIKKCSRQASTGIIKVTAYNKLQSEYLDVKANLMIEEIAAQGELGYSDTVSIRTILDALLGDYSISVKPNFVYSVNTFANYLYPGFRALTRLTAQGGNSGYYLTEYTFAREFQLEGENFNADDYYRVTIKAKALADKFNEICAAFRLDGQGVEYKYYNGDLPSGQSANGFTFDRLMELYPGDFSLRITNNTPATIVSVPLYNNTSSEIITSWFSNVSRHDAIRVYIPIYLIFETTYRTSMSTAMPDYLASLYDALIASIPNCIIVEKRNLSEMEKGKYSLNDINNWADVTLRELQSAVYETQCQFGQLDRETDLFSGVELNNSRLLPADTLYPNNALYPNGSRESAFRSQYSKLWADEGNVHKWRYLIITYKGLDGEGNEQDYTLQRTVNNDGTDNYNCSDNWLFRNLIWTAEQIGEYADAMVAKMRDITWFPFEMWCAGLPYLETGDEIEIPLGEETYTSYILQRTLKGIQNLQDTYINGTLDIF